MISEKRIPAHPGRILQEEFLTPLGVTQVELAAHLGIPVQRVNEIVNGKRGITPATAWLFSVALRTTPEIWMNLQMKRDLALKRPKTPAKALRVVAGGGKG